MANSKTGDDCRHAKTVSRPQLVDDSRFYSARCWHPRQSYDARHLKAFRAKVSVEPEAPLKSDSLIDTPFRVINESQLPIHDVRHVWLVEETRGTGGVAVGMYEVSTIADGTIPKIGSSQSVTVYPFDNFRIQEIAVKRLKMVVTITYRTAIFPRCRMENFFFEANEGAHGKFQWYHTSEPPW
jgi:hypothetical protein